MIVVDDPTVGATSYLTIPAHICGVTRRVDTDGDPQEVVPRDFTNGIDAVGAFLDVIGITSDIQPVAETIGVVGTTLDGTVFDCEDPFDAGTTTPLQTATRYNFESQCAAALNAPEHWSAPEG